MKRNVSPQNFHVQPAFNRRSFLTALSATALLAFERSAYAEDAPATPAPAADAAPAQTPAPAPEQDFSFDILSSQMKDASTKPYKAPEEVGGYLKDLTYDTYRLIRFNPDHARFADVENGGFRLQAFHMGWLFKRPVGLFEVSDGKARSMNINTDDFIYEREAREKVPEHEALPGIAGFRLHYPLNRPDIFDELIAFQGASYFRALGRGSNYGLSARGLAINTGSSDPEEFPDFTNFYVERPQPGAQSIAIYATLESPSLTGAYKFVVTPGEDTVIETTARLYLRADIPQLGIAPLTSMFLFADRNRHKFDDFRPNVHDSDGLAIETQNGTQIWRPLANPPHLASSYFTEVSPKSFGLFQRDRDFASFQDPSANYERRPSVRVEPISDWGKGTIRLVEIPSDLEANDNIVAFWMPDGGGKAGQDMEFQYRLVWGDLPPDPDADKAYVLETRAGVGGVSGVENKDGTRKFVVDFKGGMIAKLPASASDTIKPICSVNGGQIVTQTLSLIPEEGVWRLVLDISSDEGNTVELLARLEGYGRVLTEVWAYQWINA